AASLAKPLRPLRRGGRHGAAEKREPVSPRPKGDPAERQRAVPIHDLTVCTACARAGPAAPIADRREEWCARVESNHHSFRNTDLNRARLPIPPRARSEASGAVGDKPSTERCQRERAPRAHHGTGLTTTLIASSIRSRAYLRAVGSSARGKVWLWINRASNRFCFIKAIARRVALWPSPRIPKT